MAKVAREKTMNVSVGALLRVITDFASYPTFLSEVAAVDIENDDKSRPRVTFELEIIKRFQYTLEFDVQEREVCWRLVKSNFFRQNQGRWVLTPMDNNHTVVIYELDVDFGFLVPKWVSKKLTEINLPKMLESFETRAKGL